MFVHVPPPAGERWNWTDATPESPSVGAAEIVIVARTEEPSLGAVIEPPGFVLSTRTVTAADAAEFPATSVVTARRSYWPSVSAVVSSDTCHGAPVTAEPTF